MESREKEEVWSVFEKKKRKTEKGKGKNSTWGRQEEMRGKDGDRQGEGIEERK